MIYRSNLTAPDLAQHFALANPPMVHAGHDEPSDPDFQPYECGFFTHDEAAILYNIAERARGNWIDIGSRTGWTAAHIAAAGNRVWAVDPEYAASPAFAGRIERNLVRCRVRDSVICLGMKSCVALDCAYPPVSGIVIDGDHDPPNPLNDALAALEVMATNCVFVFHDTLTGLAVRDAVRSLMDRGFHCRLYWTPNGIACCWRGLPGFSPPDHVPDPNIDFGEHRANWTDFASYWIRTE